MADDEKNKLSSSAPPPPTDEIDQEWGSSGSASSKPRHASPTAKAVPAKGAKAKPAPSHDDDEDLDEEDEDEDDLEDEDDEDDDDDDDEDEDDEEERRAAPPGKAHKRLAAAPAQDWLPEWAPWATLGALLCFGILGGIGIIPVSFNLTKAAAEVPSAAPTPSTPKPAASARRAMPGTPTPGGGAEAQDVVSAAHLLVSYKGALRAAPTITRTKEEAKKRAEEALAKARKGTAFDKLVAEYSDEPNAAARGGKLGRFPRQAMVKPFADAAFALKPGQVSDVVETQFGYHVIQRTE